MENRHYILVFSVVAGIGLAFLAASLLFVWRGGELTPATDFAEISRGDGFLYGSALNQNMHGYKVALALEQRPEVLVAGSSRVMQFRGWNFRQSLVTAGGAGGSIEEVDAYLGRVLSGYTPKVVIIGVDFWWFHPAYTPSFRPDISGREVTRDKMLWMFHQLQKRRITYADVYDVLAGKRDNHYGFLALFDGEGFRPDGSWHYNLAERRRWEREFRFGDTLARIQGGTDQFLHGDTLDQNRVALLVDLLAKLREKRIPVLMFMPPMAPAIYREVLSRGDQYGYLRRIRAINWGMPMLDFTDPSALSASDCEFIDGYHAGEVVYARIAQRLAEAAPQVLATTAENQRNAAITGRPMVDLEGEDHLQLGCRPPN